MPVAESLLDTWVGWRIRDTSGTREVGLHKANSYLLTGAEDQQAANKGQAK